MFKRHENSQEYKKNASKNDKKLNGMIKDLFSNDFLKDDANDANNFAKTKYDKGK